MNTHRIRLCGSELCDNVSVCDIGSLGWLREGQVTSPFTNQTSSLSLPVKRCKSPDDSFQSQVCLLTLDPMGMNLSRSLICIHGGGGGTEIKCHLDIFPVGSKCFFTPRQFMTPVCESTRLLRPNNRGRLQSV